MLLIGPFVIFGMTLSDKAEMDAILETGRGLSEAGNTIVTMSAFLGLFLVIWVLIDLIRILTGSFTKNAEPIKIKDKGSKINILVIIVPFLLVFLFFIFQYQERNNRLAEAQEVQRQQQIQLAREKATADSLAREKFIKKKASSSKKASGLRLAPEQPQKTLKIYRSEKPMEIHKLEK